MGEDVNNAETANNSDEVNADDQAAVNDEAAGEGQESTGPKNTVTIEEVGPCKKKVSIEIPEETISKAIDDQYEDLRKDAVLPGFRKGRAPRRLLEKRFGKEACEQVKLKLLAGASEEALKDNELDVLGDPDINYEDLKLPDAGPMTFDFEVEVRPEIPLPALEGIEITRTRLEVTDEQVDREIEQMQRLGGIWTPREGAVELNDQVLADVLLSVEDVEEAEKLDNTEVFVRKNGFVGSIPVENLDELLIGAKEGETKETTVDVPKTYFKEEYRGKKVDITVEVKDVKYLKPAELDEAFFSRIGAEDEDDLREKITDSLQSRLEDQSRSEMTEQIYKYLLDSTSFDLPLDVVAQQAGTVLQRQYLNLMRRGLSREQLEEQMEQLRASSEEQAKEQLKTFFIMDAIAEKLEVTVTEEEINGHIAQMAIQQGQRPQRMREEMERNGSISQFTLQLREDKCISKMLESAKVTEKEPEKPKAAAKKTAKKTSKKAKADDDKKDKPAAKKSAKKAKTSTKKKTDE